jgi:hypothetical protein
MVMSPAERTLRAKLAAHTKLAKHDPVQSTAAARSAFLESFERAADPDGLLPPEERARRAAHLRKAHFHRLALKSAQARRKALS